MDRRVSATTSVVVDDKGIASGFRVAQSTKVRIHRFRLSVSGDNGPIKSIRPYWK